MEQLLGLTKKHKTIMDTKGVLVSVYTNASGFLWQMMKVDSGTDLGWSEFSGNCLDSGTFKTYEDALADALSLIELCDLNQFKKDTPQGRFHWGNYADHLRKVRAKKSE
jgi:hypothetical protein